MKRNGMRRTKTNRSTLIFGIILTAASFFILTFLASLLLSMIKNPLGASGIASFAVLLITGILSGFFTAKYKGEHGILPSGACALIFAFILFCTGLISSGGKIASITIINLISYVAVAFLFAALAKRRKRHGRVR